MDAEYFHTASDCIKAWETPSNATSNVTKHMFEGGYTVALAKESLVEKLKMGCHIPIA